MLFSTQAAAPSRLNADNSLTDPAEVQPVRNFVKASDVDLRPTQEVIASPDGLQVEHDDQEFGAWFVLHEPFGRSPPDVFRLVHRRIVVGRSARLDAPENDALVLFEEHQFAAVHGPFIGSAEFVVGTVEPIESASQQVILPENGWQPQAETGLCN